MPFVSENDLNVNALPVTGATLPEPPPAPVAPAFGEVVGAGFRRENTIASLAPFAKLNWNAKPVDGFNPLDHIPEQYRQYATRYVLAPDQQHVDAITRQLAMEEIDNQTLDSAGLLGVGARMAGGILDPINLVPVGGGLKAGGSILGNALRVAALNAGITAAEEVSLHATQLTRTMGESALNVAGATVLSGLLGGGITALGKRNTVTLGKQVEQELTVPQTGRFTPDEVAQARMDLDALEAEWVEAFAQHEAKTKANKAGDTSAEVLLEETDDAIRMSLQEAQLETARRRLADMEADVTRYDILEPNSLEITEAAFRRDTDNAYRTTSKTLDEMNERLVGEGWLANKANILNRQDPLIRTTTSQSAATRQVVQQLAVTPLKYEKNLEGVANAVPVERRIDLWRTGLADAMQGLDSAFATYRLGRQARIGEKSLMEVGDAFGLGGSKLTWQDFKTEVATALRNNDNHIIPEVAEAARELRRQVFDPIRQKAASLGLLDPLAESSTAPSYLTRMWDVEKINARYGEFFDRNLNYLLSKEPERVARLQAAENELAAIQNRAAATITPRSMDELRSVTRTLIARLTSVPEGRIRYDVMDDAGNMANLLDLPPRGINSGGQPGLASSLKHRAYDIPDELVEDFLVNDVEYIAKSYVRTMAPDLAIIQQFGDLGMERAIADIIADYDVKMQAASDEGVARKWAKARDNDIADIVAMRDRLRGAYALPQNPSGGFTRAGRVMRSMNFLSLMGGVAVSSIPDLAQPVMKHGLTRYLRDGWLPLVRALNPLDGDAKSILKLNKREVNLAGTALDLVLDARAQQIGEVMDDYGRGNVAERLLHESTGRFSVVTGIASWTSAMKEFTGLITQTRMLQGIVALAEGKASRKEIGALAATYIDSGLAKRMADEFAQHGRKHGTAWVANTEAWTDIEAAEVFRAGLGREVDRIIVTPGQDKPLWMSTEMGKTLGQFKSFFMATTQRVLMSGLQERDLATLNGLAVSIGLGMVSVKMHNMLTGRDDRGWEMGDWITEGLDRSGIVAWFFEANNAIEKTTRGKAGLSAMMGKPPMTRYQGRNLLDAWLGPTVGRVEDGIGVARATSSGEWHQSDVRAMRRLLPFQNLFYTRWLFDQGERGVAETLGVPVRELD